MSPHVAVATVDTAKLAAFVQAGGVIEIPDGVNGAYRKHAVKALHEGGFVISSNVTSPGVGRGARLFVDNSGRVLKGHFSCPSSFGSLVLDEDNTPPTDRGEVTATVANWINNYARVASPSPSPIAKLSPPPSGSLKIRLQNAWAALRG